MDKGKPKPNKENKRANRKIETEADAKKATDYYRNLCIAADFFKSNNADYIRKQLIGHSITTDCCDNIIKIDGMTAKWIPCVFKFE